MSMWIELWKMIEGWLRDTSVDPGGDYSTGVSKKIGWTGYDRGTEEREQRAAVVASMRADLGDSYKFGVEVAKGEESDLWDCSEKVQDAYSDAGKEMPDGAQYQYNFCRPVVSDKPGDLGFLWSDERKVIGHVMVFTGDGTVIHAVGGRGVVEDDAGRWTGHARFRGIRRHPDFARPEEDRP